MAIAFVIALKFMPAGKVEEGEVRRTSRPDPESRGRLTRYVAPREAARARLLVALYAAALLALARPPHGAAPSASAVGHTLDEPEEAAAKQLAKKYVPITSCGKRRDPPCETSAEQYQPTSVETMLGNPTVTLQHYAEGEELDDDRQGADAPRHRRAARRLLPEPRTARALGDTCVYAKDVQKAAAEEGKAPASPTPTSPANRATPASPSSTGSSGTSTSSTTCTRATGRGCRSPSKRTPPAEALQEEPSEIILFQHAGGERANWDDAKVQKEGTHPVVYPAAGSHATFYDSAVYVENGQHGSGVGCDNTTEPLRELKLRPVLMPEAAPDSGPFAWLTYRRPLGRTRKGLQQRPDRAGDEDGLARTVRLDGGAALDQPAAARRLDRRAAGHRRLLRRRRRRLGTDQPRRQSPLAAAADDRRRPAADRRSSIGVTRWRPVDLDRSAREARLRPAGAGRAPALRPPLFSALADRRSPRWCRSSAPSPCSPALISNSRNPGGTAASTSRSPTSSNFFAARSPRRWSRRS